MQREQQQKTIERRKREETHHIQVVLKYNTVDFSSETWRPDGSGPIYSIYFGPISELFS